MKVLKEKGITLVALVVTIIILLILAGVTISQIGGNNGLFSRVRQAVDKYKNASIEEQLAILEVDKYVSDFTVSEEEGALVKITKVEVTAGTDTITINVTVEGNVSKIEYSKDNEKTWQVKEDNDKSTEYTYEKVAPGSYFIKVRASDENGKSATATSDVVTVTPVTTAEEKDVLENETFLTGEGIIKTGSMKKHGTIEETILPGGEYTLEEGYYEGGTVTAEGLGTQTPGDAGAGDILKDKTAWVNGVEVTGTMPNQGKVTETLNAGGSYTIPAGYHNGQGTVAAKSLADQTVANAVAGNILKDKTAWVNGNKITGTMVNRGNLNKTVTAGGSLSLSAGYYSAGTITATYPYDISNQGWIAWAYVGKWDIDSRASTSDPKKISASSDTLSSWMTAVVSGWYFTVSTWYGGAPSKPVHLNAGQTIYNTGNYGADGRGHCITAFLIQEG